jgi:glycosyltransferase involved in cell wall biosynthesis
MRVAYIAPYQGVELIKRRPSLRNLALAGNAKIEFVADLMQRYGHDVIIISQGEVVENSLAYYPAFVESTPSSSRIPVHYASAFPVNFINGSWSSWNLLTIFKRLHRVAPFDVVLIYNLKLPQLACGQYALDKLHLPVILEHEDDAFVDVSGSMVPSLRVRWQLRRARQILQQISGGIGVSPHLVAKFPGQVPTLLLRGVVSDEIVSCARRPSLEKKNWVAFSGTFVSSKGLIPLIEAWKMIDLPGWELHIAGHGVLAEQVRAMSEGSANIVLRGLLNRQENARFLSEAKIGINPHDLSETPGNVFAFKIIEYIAAGAHVITTPMGPLERELEQAVTYLADNRPATIAAALERVIKDRHFEHTAALAAELNYGPAAVARSLHLLLTDVLDRFGKADKYVAPSSARNSESVAPAGIRNDD